MKTVEFKLDLSQSQQQAIDTCLEALTWVWNSGLALLKWREYWERRKLLNYYPAERKQPLQPLPQTILDAWGFPSLDAIPVAPLDYKVNQIKVGKKTEKVFGLTSPRTAVEKIGNLSQYPELKTKPSSITVEEIDGSIIYAALPSLQANQFIEERNIKKGVKFYLHTPAIREYKQHWKDEPPIQGYSDFDLIKFFGKKNLVENETVPENVKFKIKDLDSKLIAGQCKNLAQAWGQYKAKKRGCPRFKKYTRSEMASTFIHNSAAIREKVPDDERLKEEQSKQKRTEAKAKGEALPPVYKAPKMPVTGSILKTDSTKNQVRLPLIGWVKLKGSRTQLSERWGDTYAISYRLSREPSGYYLKLIGELPVNVKSISLNREPQAIGIDAGVVCLFADDAGRFKEPRSFKLKTERKIARLQRQAARKKLRSRNWEKLQARIARLHEEDRRRSLAADHKITTKLIREYDGIAVEDLKLANMTASVKPQVENGSYTQTGKKRKARLNKAILRNSPGRRNKMLEVKLKAVNNYFGFTAREFVAVKPQNTSKQCNACGYIASENRPSQKYFKCVNCGHTHHADVNAARNILERGYSNFVRSYRAWTWEVKPVSDGDAPLGETEPLSSKSVRQEAGYATASAGEHPAQPPRKGRTPNRNRAKQEVSKPCNPGKTTQTFSQSDPEASSTTDENRATSATPILPGLEEFFKDGAMPAKSISRKRKTRIAHSEAENSSQPSFWEATEGIEPFG